MVNKRFVHILLVSFLAFTATMVFPPVHAYLNNPYDEYLAQQWGWLRIYADVAYFNNIRGSQETIVAVIDTGIDVDHPDLQENIYTNPGEVQDGIDNDGNGYVDDIHGWNFVDNNPDISDRDGHGSHCAGIIAAIDNAIGVCGVAPEVTILPLKIIDTETGDPTHLLNAIAYACIMNASIISMSIGIEPSLNATLKAKIDQVIDLAYYGNKTTLVAAAGNTDPEGIEEVMYPASSPRVIAVGATTKSDTKAYYSNFGNEIEIAAPGGDLSDAIISTYNESNYMNSIGTSMACPYVSGIIALILQQDSTLTPDEIRAIISSTAEDLGAPGRDKYFGYGLINAASCLGLPKEHTYDLFLDWIMRNIGWILLIAIAFIFIIIYQVLKPKSGSESDYYPDTSPSYY